ncbi:hypothetical protein HQ563_04715 [bacterium]|nr:hypothetical protein [bacterium]
MSNRGTVNPTVVLLLLLVLCPFLLAFLMFLSGTSGEFVRRWGFLFIVIIALLFATISPRLVRAKRLSRLRAREGLLSDDFYEKFYSSSGLDRQSVAAAVKHVSDTLRLPGELLRPSDHFDKEYKPPAGFEQDDEIVDLGWDLNEMYRKRGMAVDEAPIDTLDDYIRRYCNLLSIPEKKRGRRPKRGERL